MRKKIAFTVLWVGIFPPILNAHQFYLSITNIRHHEETQKLTVQVRLFVNDLEESIFQEQGVRIGLWKNKPVENVKSYIEQYVSSKLSISINNSSISLKFINQKLEPAEVLEDDIIICELEAYNVSEITTIKVYNSLLTEAFDSQINIIKIRANNTKKVLNLDGKLPEEQVTFD